MKIDIRSLSEDELCEFFVKRGFDSYRGKQVYEWIWKKSSYTFDNMTNICLLYTSPSPRDRTRSRMPSSA